ncbi:MAG: response regulator [Candidatus Sericytochromatia bacterium]
MTSKIRIVVADDHPMVLRGTVEMLEEAPDFEVVAQARDGAEALEAVLAHQPDVAVLDVQMPRMDGIAVVRELVEKGQKVGLLMLSANDDDGAILQALQAGANGYLLKTADEDEIHQAVRLVAEGQPAILQPEVAKIMVANMRKPAEPEQELLSERELEVVRTLAKDLGNKEIAKRLGISDRTVQQHLANVFGKLGVGSRTGAVLRALREGWITLEDTRE